MRRGDRRAQLGCILVGVIGYGTACAAESSAGESEGRAGSSKGETDVRSGVGPTVEELSPDCSMPLVLGLARQIAEQSACILEAVFGRPVLQEIAPPELDALTASVELAEEFRSVPYLAAPAKEGLLGALRDARWNEPTLFKNMDFPTPAKVERGMDTLVQSYLRKDWSCEDPNRDAYPTDELGLGVVISPPEAAQDSRRSALLYDYGFSVGEDSHYFFHRGGVVIGDLASSEASPDLVFDSATTAAVRIREWWINTANEKRLNELQFIDTASLSATAFQMLSSAHGDFRLVVDGIAGPKTIKALRAAPASGFDRSVAGEEQPVCRFKFADWNSDYVARVRAVEEVHDGLQTSGNVFAREQRQLPSASTQPATWNGMPMAELGALPYTGPEPPAGAGSPDLEYYERQFTSLTREDALDPAGHYLAMDFPLAEHDAWADEKIVVVEPRSGRAVIARAVSDLAWLPARDWLSSKDMEAEHDVTPRPSGRGNVGLSRGVYQALGLEEPSTGRFGTLPSWRPRGGTVYVALANPDAPLGPVTPKQP